MQNSTKSLLIAGAVAFSVMGGLLLLDNYSSPDIQKVGQVSITSKNTKTSTPASTEATSEKQVSAEDLTKTQLLFLIEEEKLAHDVYTVMYEKYGANVFGNILESETSHQARVLTLLQVRSIPDPRSSEIGVFKNADLQAFYDKLIAQGNTNVTEAYKAGVAIEERDIADISAQLATTTEEDVVTTLEALRRGSESHLRAFNRQL